jgi:tRNA pseudouridine38-40 synthase
MADIDDLFFNDDNFKNNKVKESKRILLIVAYDGTGYCGWQKQPNGITVEEILNRALNRITGEKIEVIGASRTDSGVHALGNVAVFDTVSPIPAEKFSYCLNKVLPPDIVIQSSRAVPEDFHPRHEDCIKTYEYRIYNSTFPNPMRRRFTHFLYYKLDVSKMQEAAVCLLGEHDFKSFANPGGQQKTSVRNIKSLDITRDGEEIIIRISGNGFLYNMVRIIAGTLIKVGLGMYQPEHVKEILEAGNRNAAGPTAPACGLTMVGIVYDRFK